MRLRMPCIDRVGLVNDVTTILAERSINIVSIEVERGAVFLECQRLSSERQKELVRALVETDGINSVEPVAFMPSKERAEQLDAVLTTVQDGILAIDQTETVTQCNPAAAHILRLTPSEILGRSMGEIRSINPLIKETLKTGKVYRNREIFLEDTNSYCIVSTIPLRDSNGEVVGAVAVIRDIRDVRDLVQKMTGSLPVTFTDIPYVSTTMQRVVTQALRYAASDSTVLILGETGTGKELFARALHGASARKKATFVPVNCAAIPDTLLESELFGYECGAFTGAVKGGKPGLFEMANGGTLFLDEIGEVSVHLQAKLLRVLQERRVRRLGGVREQQVDVRIIAATNRDIEDMVARKLFREDLYYRLNVIPLPLPPLRERREDIRLLAEYFLKRFAEKLRRTVAEFTSAAIAKLEEYSWPGNVRELENVIERAVNLVDGTKVDADHIRLGRIPTTQGFLPSIKFETYQTLEERLGEVEKAILEETLRRFKSSRRAGAALGLSHTAVLKKMHRYKIFME